MLLLLLLLSTGSLFLTNIFLLIVGIVLTPILTSFLVIQLCCLSHLSCISIGCAAASRGILIYTFFRVVNQNFCWFHFSSCNCSIIIISVSSMCFILMFGVLTMRFYFRCGMFWFQENLYQWIWRQQEGGSRVATVDVLNYIQVGLPFLPFAYNIILLCMLVLLRLGDCYVANRYNTRINVVDLGYCKWVMY